MMESPKALPSVTANRLHPPPNTATAPTHSNVGLRLRLIQPTLAGHRGSTHRFSYDGIAKGASIGYRELTAPTAQRRNGTAHLNVGLRLRLIQPTMAGHPVRRTAFRRMESPEALTSVTTKWLHTPSNVETAPTHLTSEYAGLTLHRGTADRFRRMESAKALPSFTANRGTSPVNDPAYTSGSFKRRRGKDA